MLNSVTSSPKEIYKFTINERIWVTPLGRQFKEKDTGHPKLGPVR